MCAAYGTQGHPIQERTVLVGYACDKHSMHQQQSDSSSRGAYSDSGYGTASHGSHRHSSRRHRRWNILSSITGYSWQSSPLVRFEFEHWVLYLFSFRRRTSSAPPSELTILLVGHDRLTPSSAPWSPASSSSRSSSHLYIYIRHTYIEERTKRAMPWSLRSYRRRKRRETQGLNPHTHTLISTQFIEVCIA